jgi:hypothetical protein
VPFPYQGLSTNGKKPKFIGVFRTYLNFNLLSDLFVRNFLMALIILNQRKRSLRSFPMDCLSILGASKRKIEDFLFRTGDSRLPWRLEQPPQI